MMQHVEIEIRRIGLGVKLAAIMLIIAIGSCTTIGNASPIKLKVSPSETDPAITKADESHIILRDGNGGSEHLLLWLTGTGGTPGEGAGPFFKTALANGYRVIGLSYIDTPAVAQICQGGNLKSDSECAAHFRQKRIFGDNATPLIHDKPQDAIVHRLTALLTYLVANDPEGHWDEYLVDRQPAWRKIVLAGQSQGGGMAAFIAKKYEVAGVIDFSGGWDYSAPNKIATWYSGPSATPTDRWFGTLNANEGAAQAIADSYDALDIPRAHQLILNRPSSMTPHTAGCCDAVYWDIWERMLKLK